MLGPHRHRRARKTPRRLLVGALALTGLLTVALPPAGTAGAAPGDWTSITTPSGTFTVQDPYPGGATFHVAGHAAAGISTVDVDCMETGSDGAFALRVVANVAVTGGAFSTTGHVGPRQQPCRLRAVPHGADTTGYLGSFAGPIAYFPAYQLERDPSGVTFDYDLIVERGDVADEVWDAADCGISEMTSHDPASGEPAADSPLSCGGQLQDVPDGHVSGPLRIDGHRGLLPEYVRALVNAGFPVKQTRLTVTRTVAGNGDTTVRESAPVVRCAGDTWPPTKSSCSSLVPTGITFVRTTRVIRGGHQITQRDSFTGTDAKPHVVDALYGEEITVPASGEPGMAIPGHGTTFGAVPTGTVTGLGTRAETLYLRSDRFAAADSPQASTVGLTWSRPPASITFLPPGVGNQVFTLRYVLRVAAHATGFVGLATSQQGLTSQVRALAAAAQAEMVAVPQILRPAPGAHLKSDKVTVSGRLSVGGNGLPVGVSVAGHVAGIHRSSATAATYAATFRLRRGWHVLTVVARDAAGNTRRVSVRVHAP